MHTYELERMTLKELTEQLEASQEELLEVELRFT